MTPRLEKDLLHKANGGPSVLSVAGLTVGTAAIVLCVLATVVIYFRRKKQLIA